MAIGTTRGDVKGIEHPQTVFQVRHRSRQLLNNSRRPLPIGPSQAVAPALLTLLEMHGLQGLFNGLMGRKTGPFVVTGLRAETGLGQIRLRLM